MNTKLQILFVTTLLCGCVACNSPKEEPQEMVDTVLPEEASVVTVQPLAEVDFQHELISNGKLTAKRRVDLRFESMAVINRIYVKNGDWVHKGAKLAELDGFKLQHDVDQAIDALDKARLEMQDVLIGQGFMLADSAKVPASILRLAKLKSGYEQAESAYSMAIREREQGTLVAPFDGLIANLFSRQGNLT